MMAQAMMEAISCPTGHQTERRVSMLFEAKGKNSRNKAPSTGRFPPTPRPMHPNKRDVAIQEGPAAMADPKAPQMNKVVLKAMRRPIMSDAMPQNVDPIDRPTKVIIVVYLTRVLLTPNSVESCGSTSAKPCIQRLK